VCGHERILVPGFAGRSLRGAARPRIGFNEVVEIAKDGQSWRIGTNAQIGWIANGTSIDQTITSAIPPVFAAYATFWQSDDDSVSTTVYEQAVLSHLIEQTAADQPWWLGYLDTGSHDVVFNNAPRVTLYACWHYVLVEAGPKQAATWRTGHPRSPHGNLPDLIFPADRSWLVSALWDDTSTCVGGPRHLIDALAADILAQSRSVQLDEDATPPGHHYI
jgi:hypothetical protein